MDDVSICASTMTKAATTMAQLKKVPTDVRSWPNFKEDLSRHRQNIPAELLLRSCRNLRRPMTDNGVITVKLEADICSAFPATICDALDQLFIGEMVISSFSASGLVAVESMDNPDFVTVMRRMPSEQFVGSSSGAAKSTLAGIQPSNAGVADGSPMTAKLESVTPATCSLRIELVSFVEIKLINFSMYGRELEILYRHGKWMVQDAIYQITGYHCAYNCKYGFISNYKHTWATYLDNNRVLYVSPCFISDAVGEFSTLNMMYFVNRKAFDGLNSRSEMWTPPCFFAKIQSTKRAPSKRKNCTPSKKQAAQKENEVKASQE
jgi:hypothetical protein